LSRAAIHEQLNTSDIGIVVGSEENRRLAEIVGTEATVAAFSSSVMKWDIMGVAV
jgi:hypothetical protein